MEKTLKAILALFLLICWIQPIQAATKAEQIFIVESVPMETGQTVKGEVDYSENTLEFEGKLKKVKRKITIEWNKVNQKKLKPPFKSTFYSSSKTLVAGTTMKIRGSFKKLAKKMDELEKEKAAEKDTSEEGGLLSELESTAEGGENGSLDSSSVASNKSVTGGSSTSTGTGTDQNNTPTYTFETCPSKVDGSTILIQKKRIATYPNGTVETGSCETEESYPIVSTSVGCSIRHDLQNLKSYEQQKQIYFDSSGNEITIKACSDTNTTYAHHKMIADCEEFIDKSTGLTPKGYKQKKTYIIDKSGEVVFISGCQIDAKDITEYSEADFLREYSDKDFIDRVNLVAYRRYRNYLQIDDQKIFMSGYINDPSNTMTIKRDYEQCAYRHDVDAQISYKRYAEVYYKDGERKVVSDCMPDSTKTFAHVTDDKYCHPKIINQRMYQQTGTYFTDDTGSRVQVKECSLTNYELLIDNSDVGKNFSACKPRIDLDNGRAYGLYREEIEINGKKEFLSACKEDPDKYFLIQETESGCTNKVVTEQNRAYQQKRKFYFNDSENVFITNCEPTTNYFEFETSSADCPRRLSTDQTKYLEYEEVFYRDFNGQKRIVNSCAANGVEIAISQADIKKDYGVCSLSMSLNDSKVYHQYKEYIQLNGAKTYISECKEDPEKFFAISEKPEGCSYRMDYANEKAVMQARKFYNNGYEDITVTECFDTVKSFAFQKSAENCSQKVSNDKSKVIEYKEIYYIDNNGVKVTISACAPTGVETVIEESDKVKKYDSCPNLADYAAEKVYKQFQTWTTVNGKEELLVGCTPDREAPAYVIKKDYSQCAPRVDTVLMEATEQHRLFYETGGETTYLTECISSDIVHTLKINKVDCPTIPVENSENVIFQQKMYYINSQNNENVTVKECYPTDVYGVIEEKLCDDKYVHDFIANQTYYQTKFIYKKPDNTEEILKPCKYSVGMPVMPHKEEVTGYSHNDSTLKSTVQSRIYIEDNGTKVYITNPANSQIIVPFTYTGESTQGKTVHSTASGNTPPSCTSNRNYYYCNNFSSCKGVTDNSYTQKFHDYLRADNTTYKKMYQRDCTTFHECSSCSGMTGYCFDKSKNCGWE